MNDNPYLLTLPELISARKKIGTIAAFYDPTWYSLEGFSRSHLNPTEFREQVSRNFRIHLTDAELGALVYLFDRDGDGTVDAVEFITEFFKMGKLERKKIELTHKAEQAIIQRKNDDFENDRREKYMALAKTRVATKWTPAEEASAIKKVATVAFTYDALKGGMEEFMTCDSMTPIEFRGQMYRNFLVKLSPEETAALVKIFDKDGDGTISCKEFMYQFFRIGRKERDRHVDEQHRMTRKLIEAENKLVRDIQYRLIEKTQFKTRPATEADKESALRKLRIAAAYYNKDNVIIPPLQTCFASSAITPTIFRELLKHLFQIKLSPGEMDAAVTMFDANGDGYISCAEFLSKFFEMSNEERHRIIREKNEETRRIQQIETERNQKLIAKIMKNSTTHIKWPKLPGDDEEDDDEDRDGDEGKAVLKFPPLCVDTARDSDEEEKTGPGSPTKGSPKRGSPKKGSPKKGPHGSPAGSPVAEDLSPRSRFVNHLPTIRTYRKESVVAAMSPVKGAPLISNDESFVKLFPKTSMDTKKFLLSVEKEEKAIAQTSPSSQSLKSPKRLPFSPPKSPTKAQPKSPDRTESPAAARAGSPPKSSCAV